MIGYIEIARIVLFAAPIYIANSSAVVFHGKRPLDFNKKFFDKREIFGEGKTVKGAFFGIFFGSLAALILGLLIPDITQLLYQNYFLLGFLLASGAIAGDLAGSFIKRRFGIERGRPIILLDQLDFIAGALLFALPFAQLTLTEIAIIAIATLIIHRIANIIAYKIKLKRNPW